MLPLAIVLVLTPAAPHVQSLTPPPLARGLSPPCPDIDRGFVRYVAPPEGQGPLWPVKGPDPRSHGLGPAAKASEPQPPPVACPRLQGVGGR